MSRSRFVSELWPHIRNLISRGEGNLGGFSHCRYSGLGASSKTIIPDGQGDVTGILRCMYTVVEVAGGGTSAANTNLSPGTAVNIYNDGTDVLQLAVAANGSVTIRRLLGTDTFNVSLWLVWV